MDGTAETDLAGVTAAQPTLSASRLFSGLQYRVINPVIQWVSRLLDRIDPIGDRISGTATARVLQVAIFPVFITLTPVIGFWLARNGITARDFVGNIIMFAIYGVIFMPLERLIPWSRNWRKGDGDAAADIMFFFGNKLWGDWITHPLRLATIVYAINWIGPEIGKAIWPTMLHPVVQVLLLLIVNDFFRYWYHRWMHEVPFMWRWHAVHHSSTRLYWYNGARSHPVEGMVQGFLFAIPLALVKAPVEIVFVAGLLGRTIGRFQHTNMNLKLGFLDYLFSSPKNHRYHHSRRIEEGNSNYGGDVIIWDHLFGTFHMPKGQEPGDDIGIGDRPHYPKSWWGMMKAPFLPQVDRPGDGQPSGTAQR